MKSTQRCCWMRKTDSLCKNEWINSHGFEAAPPAAWWKFCPRCGRKLMLRRMDKPAAPTTAQESAK